jgi:hypothetical protein
VLLATCFSAAAAAMDDPDCTSSAACRGKEKRGRAWAADPFPLAARSFESSLRPLDQARSLLLGHPAEDRHQERSYGAARVEPGLPHADHRHADPVALQDRLDGAHHRAVVAIERPDDDRAHATSTGIGEHPVEDGSCLRCRLDLLVDHRLAPTRGRELAKLGYLVLAGLLWTCPGSVLPGGPGSRRAHLTSARSERGGFVGHRWPAVEQRSAQFAAKGDGDTLTSAAHAAEHAWPGVPARLRATNKTCPPPPMRAPRAETEGPRSKAGWPQRGA